MEGRVHHSGDPAPSLLSSSAAGVLVFVSSGAVLVLELSALRLLAPYVGLTLEMSTAVIGVALAAIAFGTWVGGRAADVLDPARTLAPLLLLSAIVTWLVLPAVRGIGELTRGQDVSLVLLMATLTLFAPAALLSAVTPMVIKLELRSLDRTGAIVGRLSALGTLGALLATFGTGFVLFALVPTSRIIVALGAVLAVLGAVLLVRARRMTALAVAAAVGLGSVALALLAPDPCDVETRYHCASVAADPERSGGRTLVLDRLRHSYVDVDDPTHLEFAYVRAIAAAIDASFDEGEPIDALHLGSGGMTLPRYIAQTRPGSTGLVLEIDEGVVSLVRSAIAPDPAGVTVRTTDARLGLERAPSAMYDLVVGDAFGSVAVPWHLATREAVQQVRRTVAPGGLYALNVIDQPPLSLMRAEVATVRAVFDEVALVSTPAMLSGDEGGNAVVLASQAQLPIGALTESLSRDHPDLALLAGGDLDSFVGQAEVLTDDYAPVDQLLTPYAVDRGQPR